MAQGIKVTADKLATLHLISVTVHAYYYKIGEYQLTISARGQTETWKGLTSNTTPLKRESA